MFLYSMAFDFNCKFEFSKACISHKGCEFILHNGGDNYADVIETILDKYEDRDSFSQVAFNFCLSFVACNSCNFAYLDSCAMSLHEKIDIFDKNPFIKIPRNSRSVLVPLNYIKKVDTEEQSLVSSLFNDATSSNNPFFKFLCYWKILEIPINSKSRKATDWIDSTVKTNPELVESSKELKEEYDKGINIGKYFKDNYRDAVAHIARPPHLSSHNFNDYKKVTEACDSLNPFIIHFMQNEITWEKGLSKVNIIKIENKGK
ncbi:MAG: methylamine utilization protein MauJ [Candidatus Scalinduaceae bacterium]